MILISADSVFDSISQGEISVTGTVAANIVISCSAGILWLTPRYANGKLSTSLARKNYTN